MIAPALFHFVFPSHSSRDTQARPSGRLARWPTSLYAIHNKQIEREKDVYMYTVRCII